MAEVLRTAQELESAGLLLVQDGNHGEYRPRRDEFCPDGTAFIRAADMGNGRIYFDSAQSINVDATQRIRKGVGAPLDVVLSHKGTVGKVAFATADAPPFVCSPQTTFWRSLDHSVIEPRFLYACLQSDTFQAQLRARENESDMAAYVSLTQQRQLLLPVPPIQEQLRIATVLGALDDEIAVNEHIAASTRTLGITRFLRESHSAPRVDLGSVVSSLTRGVSPKYSEDVTELLVVNQKCIRNGRVSLTQARRTMGEKVTPLKRLQRHDVLVNSTGVGTLGRVARWTGTNAATVDSHVTIVRLDPEKIDPVCGGFALLAAQPHIESMGEGSTGQTELRRTQLQGLEIKVPDASQGRLRSTLESLENRGDAALTESETLAALRDTLLPQLISGKLRVRDAERIVEDAT